MLNSAEEKIAVVRRKSVPALESGTSSGDDGWASSVSELGGVRSEEVDFVRRERREEESPRERSFASAC